LKGFASFSLQARCFLLDSTPVFCLSSHTFTTYCLTCTGWFTTSSLQELIYEVVLSQKCHINKGPILSGYGYIIIWLAKIKYLHEVFIAESTINVQNDHPQPKYTSWHVCESSV
jgi:hypothetical protein